MNRPPLKNSAILITGGAGFIGSHLADRLYAAGAKNVIVIDNLFLGQEENLVSAREKGLIFYRDDAELPPSLEAIFNRHTIDIVFNCATKALNYSFVNPADAFQTNVTVVMNLLEAQRKKAFITLCHFSTSEVYGTAVYEPMDEKHPRRPTTAYAAGKAAADLAVESYAAMFNLDAFIVRPFNNYGPRQNHEGYLAGVIPLTISRILTGAQPEIHGTGKQSRDYMYVLDTVEAVLQLYDKLGAGESVNVAAHGQITIKEVVETICRLMEYRGEIVYKEARRSDVLCHNADTRKMGSLITCPITPFDAGLQKTVDWYREHLSRKGTSR
jgi:UDP-glucose 4-epimerase